MQTFPVGVRLAVMDEGVCVSLHANGLGKA